MNRTVLVVGSLMLLALSAGCLGGVSPGNPSSASDDSPHMETSVNVPESPEKPANLTTESVAEYAWRYERAATYEAVKNPDSRVVSLICNATVEHRTKNGFYARAGCANTIRSNDGVGTGGPGIGRAYFINDTTTIRPEVEREFDRSRTAAYKGPNESENVMGAPNLRILNFDTEPHNVAVSLTYLGTTPPESAFENEYEVSAEGGVEQDTVTLRKGTYRLRVRLGNGTTATSRWNVTEDTKLVAVHIMRSGEIAIRTPTGIRLPES